MIFFDFLYYSVYKYYFNFNEIGAASTSAGIIGGFQALNVLTVILFMQFLLQQKSYINKLLVVALFVAFQVFTYYRYIYKDDHSVGVLEKKWLGKTEVFRQRISVILFLYVVVSVIGCFGLAIYLGYNK